MLGIPEEHFKGIENKITAEPYTMCSDTQKKYQNIEKYINRIIHSN